MVKTMEQIVVFKIEGQSYGANIKEVSEVIRMKPVTSIPNTPSYIEGIINLRGNICTIFNLRKVLGFSGEIAEQAKIIVVDEAKAGLIVDNVTEIITVDETNIRSIDNLESMMKSGLVDYLVESKGEIITVLRIKDIIGQNDFDNHHVAV
jgi:purine-binding chemotaxis protein CheW